MIGYSLLITGAVCNSTGQWISDKGDCLNIYITGLLMAFIMSVVWLFVLLAYLLDRCDVPEVQYENPVVQPICKIKKKKSPLQIIVE